MENSQNTMIGSNAITDKFHLKYLKYKYKYEKLQSKTILLNQFGGNLYNVHHNAGELGNAITAAKVVDISNYPDWFKQMGEWSRYHDNPAIDDNDRIDAREEIQIMLDEMNGLFIKAKSEIRFRWTSANWNSGVQWLN
jgi:hypothetical protein